MRAEDREGLLEGLFDLESQAIDSDDVQGGQGGTKLGPCTSAGWRRDGAGVQRRSERGCRRGATTGRRLGGRGSPPCRHRLGWAPPGSGRSLSARATLIFFPYFAGLPLGRGRFSGGGVTGKKAMLFAFDPRDQVVSLTDVAGGIVSVGHEIERLLQAQRVDQQDHLVQQRSLVAIGKRHAFVDATRQRQGEYA